MIVKLLGYAPDADPTVVGVLTNCSGVVPSLRGLKGAPSPAATPLAALAATCQGAAVVTKVDNTTRLFAGTATNLYEAAATSWADVTRPIPYTMSGSQRWRFTQFGDVSLATNPNDTVQYSNSTGSFTDILGAPAAAIIETVGQFVFAFNTTDGTYGISKDRWWCAALGGYTDWTPAIATQCATGRLTSTPGQITAARKLGDSIIVYKQKSMFLGTYVGSPVIWSFSQITNEIGAMNQESVVTISTPENPKQIFMGADNFYLYDGTKPTPIGTNRIKVQVFSTLLQSRFYACYAMHDKINSLVYFYYPVADSSLPDHCVVYNYRTDEWGQDDRQIEAALEYVSPGITYNSLGATYSTYDSLPSLPYDEAFLSSALTIPAIFDTTHNLKSLTGIAATTSITTGDLGDDTQFNCLTRIRPRFLTAPTSATLTNYYKNSEGDPLTTGSTTSLTNGKFDVLRESRWHRFTMSFVGDWEMPGFSPEYEQAGLE